VSITAASAHDKIAAGPAVCAQAVRDIEDPAIRYSVIDGFNALWRLKLSVLLHNDNTIAADQMIRYPKVADASRYTFSLWAFPEEIYPDVVADSFDFCRRYFPSGVKRKRMRHKLTRRRRPIWRKQLHTLDHPPLLVIVEPILTRLEAGNDRMPCCRRMLGRMLARGTVAATDVPTLRTPAEMKPPAFR
jgi:hypothetical protein